MNALAEDATLAIVVGLSLVGMLLVAWWQTGRMPLLAAAGAMLLGTLGIVFYERGVVTDREQLTDQLHALASAVVAQDHDTVVAALDPTQPALAQRARAALALFRITSVQLTDVQTQVTRVASPPRASTQVVARVGGGPRREGVSLDMAYVGLHIEWVLKPEGWKIVDYRESKIELGQRPR